MQQVTSLFAASFMLAAWLIPNHYPPWSSSYNDGTMLLALVLLSTAAFTLRLPRGLPSAVWAVLLIAAVPWLQLAFGLLKFSGDAWVASLYLFCLATAINTGFASAKPSPRDFAALLASTALAAALASSVLAMTQCLETADWGIWAAEIASGDRGIGNIAQPNNLGTLIAIGAIGLWLLFEQRRIGATAACVVLLPLLIGVTLTQSRTALLFGPAVLLIRWLAQRRNVAWRTPAAAIVAVIAVQFLFGWLWPLCVDALLLKPLDTLAARGVQTGRLQVWPVLLDAVSMSPWTGYGWLQTGAGQLAAADRHPQGFELFMQAHDVFLDLLLWCGIPLGLALSGLIVAWFVSRVRGVASVEAAVGMMVVAVFGIHAMLELPHHYAYFLIPVGLWIGVVEAERGARVWPTPASRLAPLAGFAAPLLAALTAALALAIAWNYPAVEEDFRLVRFENLSIGSLRARQPAPDAPFLSSLTAYLRFARMPITAGMRPADLAFMDAVVKRYPYSPALYRYAKALALNGRLPEAQLMFVKLRRIHGELRYQPLRRALHQQVLEGEGGLQALDAALPA